MPTIIVEDGSIVANANSYVDLDYVKAFADDRGVTLPNNDTTLEQMIIKAMDYLEHVVGFSGYIVDDTQRLNWPRQNVYVGNLLQATDSVPTDIKNAVAQLVCEQVAGNKLYPQPITSANEGRIIKKKVGPLEKTFSTSGGVPVGGRILFPAVEAFLRSYIVNGQLSLYR